MGWGIELKYVEIESFSKSFLLFFISMGTLLGVVFYLNYQRELQSFDEKLLTKMHLCSYSLECKEYTLDFKSKEENKPYILTKNDKEVASFYPIKDASDFYLKLSLTIKAYHEKIHYLHRNLMMEGVVTLVVIIFLSALFSLYALYPLRNALALTREFVKDILHDFNTPIATMRLNLSLLKRQIGENKKVSRIERSIDNILWLEENLRDYLHAQISEVERFNLLELISERVQMIEQNYPKLTYSIDIEPTLSLETHKQDFVRVVDNIIINASKYNKEQGSVEVFYVEKEHTLTIKDRGKGIKNPKKIFKRFYKEHERGLGIGLHIVQKLTKRLKIKIDVESQLGEGTVVRLILNPQTTLLPPL